MHLSGWLSNGRSESILIRSVVVVSPSSSSSLSWGLSSKGFPSNPWGRGCSTTTNCRSIYADLINASTKDRFLVGVLKAGKLCKLFQQFFKTKNGNNIISLLEEISRMDFTHDQTLPEKRFRPSPVFEGFISCILWNLVESSLFRKQSFPQIHYIPGVLFVWQSPPPPGSCDVHKQ